MAFDVAKIRQAQTSKFYQSYINNLMEQSTQGGSFGWDGKNASFVGGSSLGSLSQEWNKFKKAAESRRITPDYMQFLQMYNIGKRENNAAFANEFNKLYIRSGQNDKAIADLANSSGEFKNKLIRLSTDESLPAEDRLAYQGFLDRAHAEIAPGQFEEDWEEGNLMYPAAGAVGLGGAGYLLTRQAGDTAGAASALEKSVFDYEDALKKGTEGSTKIAKEANALKSRAQERFSKLTDRRFSAADLQAGNVPKNLTFKDLEEATEGGYKISKESKYYKRYREALDKAREAAKPENLSNVKAARSSLDKAKNALEEAGESWARKGTRGMTGFYAKPAFAIGAGFAGEVIGGYLGGKKREDLGRRIGRLAPELAFLSNDIARGLATPAGQKLTASVYKAFGAQAQKATTVAAKEAIKKKAATTLGAEMLKLVGKAGTRQALGSSLPIIGNVAMGLWTAYDAYSLFRDWDELTK